MHPSLYDPLERILLREDKTVKPAYWHVLLVFRDRAGTQQGFSDEALGKLVHLKQPGKIEEIHMRENNPGTSIRISPALGKVSMYGVVRDFASQTVKILSDESIGWGLDSVVLLDPDVAGHVAEAGARDITAELYEVDPREIGRRETS